MCGGIDGHCLIDTIPRERMFWRDFPATIALQQGQTVWRISIYLVRAAENKRCVGTIFTSRLEQRERAISVNGKVHDGIACSPLMRRLRRCMDYDGNIGAESAEYALHCCLVAVVGIIVPVTSHIRLLCYPLRVV